MEYIFILIGYYIATSAEYIFLTVIKFLYFIILTKELNNSFLDNLKWIETPELY